MDVIWIRLRCVNAQQEFDRKVSDRKLVNKLGQPRYTEVVEEVSIYLRAGGLSSVLTGANSETTLGHELASDGWSTACTRSMCTNSDLLCGVWEVTNNAALNYDPEAEEATARHVQSGTYQPEDAYNYDPAASVLDTGCSYILPRIQVNYNPNSCTARSSEEITALMNLRLCQPFKSLSCLGATRLEFGQVFLENPNEADLVPGAELDGNGNASINLITVRHLMNTSELNLRHHEKVNESAWEPMRVIERRGALCGWSRRLH